MHRHFNGGMWPSMWRMGVGSSRGDRKGNSSKALQKRTDRSEAGKETVWGYEMIQQLAWKSWDFFFNEKQESHQQNNVIKCSTQLPLQGRALALTLARDQYLPLMPLRRICSLRNVLQSCLKLKKQLVHAPLGRYFGEERDFVKDTATTLSPILKETVMGLPSSREDSTF